MSASSPPRRSPRRWQGDVPTTAGRENGDHAAQYAHGSHPDGLRSAPGDNGDQTRVTIDTMPTKEELLRVPNPAPHDHPTGEMMRFHSSSCWCAQAHADLMEAQAVCEQRNHQGRQGRWGAHDTARRRYIKHIAVPGLRLGKLPKPNDLRLLHGPAQHLLAGSALKEMADWVKMHAPDPRHGNPTT